MFQAWPESLSLAENIQRMKPVFIENRLNRDARLLVLERVSKHYLMCKNELLVAFGKQMKSLKLMVKHNYDRLNQLAGIGATDQFEEFKRRINAAAVDPDSDPTFAARLSVFAKRFERKGMMDEAQELLDIIEQGTIERRDEVWQEVKDELRVLNARFGSVGRPFELNSGLLSRGDVWKDFNNRVFLLAFIGRDNSQLDELKNQCMELSALSENDNITLVLVHPTEQSVPATLLKNTFGSRLRMELLEEQNGEVRRLLNAEQGNLAMGFDNGVLVHSNMGINKMYIFATSAGQ